MTYLEKEAEAIDTAKQAYREALLERQSTCDHKTVLKHTSSSYVTYRICEDCGYHESVQWDSSYRYKDQRLLGRAYEVDWATYADALPAVRL